MVLSADWIQRRIVNALKDQPTGDLYSFLINQGRGYTLSDRVSDLGNEESIYVYLENPTDEYDYDVVVMPRASGRADLDISFNASEGDSGTEATVNNLKSGSENAFSGTAGLSRTGDAGTLPSHGEMFIEDFVPGSGQGTNVAAQVVDAVAFTIDEGDNKLLELRNESGGQVDRIGLNIVIFEIDGTYKTTE